MRSAAFLLWLISPLIFPAGSTRNDLKCYQCTVEDNSLCTEEDLKSCADDQAYDACMTVVKKTKAEGFHIIKKCVLRPCTMDSSQSKSLGLNDCDRSKEEFECVSCCTEDGCNKDGATSLNLRDILPTTAVLLVLLLVLQSQLLQFL